MKVILPLRLIPINIIHDGCHIGCVIFLKFHEAIFGKFAPIDARVFFTIGNVFFALRASSPGLIRKKLDFLATMRAFDVADL